MQACRSLGLRFTVLHATVCLFSGLLSVSTQALATNFPGPQLNDEPVHIQNPEWRSNFSMARSADGRAIIAWSEDSHLKLQRISSTGNAVDAVTQLNAGAAESITAISSAMDDSGRYAVAYAKDDDVYLRRFAADGTARDADWISTSSVPYGSVDNGITAPDCGSSGQLSWKSSGPQVAVNAGGHTAMVWQRIGYCPGPVGTQAVDYRVYLREITADGTGQEPRLIYRDERAYGYTSYAPGDNFHITVASDDSVYFAWRREVQDYAPENLIRPLRLKRYVSGVAGTTLTVTDDFKRLSGESTSDLHQVQGVALAELSSGELVIAWNSSEADPQYSWLTLRRTDFRLLDQDSQALGPVIAAGAGSNRLTGLAVDGQGGFTLSFIGTGSPVSVQHLRYDAEGTLLGSWYPSGDVDFRNDIRVTYNFPRISNGNYLLLHITGEIGGTGQALDNSRRELLVVPYGGPAGTQALYFKANKTQAEPIDVLGDVMLRWATNVEGTCQKYQNWQGQFSAPASSFQQMAYAAAGERNYQIVCPGGLNKTVTINVAGGGTPAPAPTLTLTLEPESIDIGASASLGWSSSNASGCTASGAWSGARSTGGSESTGAIGAPGTYTYTLACTGSGGAVTRSVDLDVRGNSTPDAFAFTAASDVDPGSLTVSNVVAITGLSASASVSIAGGEYRIDTGAFTTQPGTIQPDQSVQVRTTASATAGATMTTTLTIGGIEGSFSVTTRMPPDASTAVISDAPGGSVMLVASAGALTNTRTVPTPLGAPANRDYLNGFLAFDIEDVPPGSEVTVTLILPAGSRPNTYVKCSADGSSCTDFAGATFEDNKVILTLTDNGAGDSNPEPGVISDPGAPAVRATPPGRSGGGSLAPWLLMSLLGLAILRRQRR